jgi:predicted RNase H-like nuclease (RuvC/YqgF family)
MSNCKTCDAKRKFLAWDNDFCTLECKAAWLEKRVKELTEEVKELSNHTENLEYELNRARHNYE